MIRHYYQLTKPGIVYGNAISAIAGFFIASTVAIDYSLLVAMLVGLSLVIASGCVFNNVIDRDIDGLMERTKKRALVRGTIPLANAFTFGAILFFLGIGMLWLFTNQLTVAIASLGFFVYVIVYSVYLKRTSVHSTLVGSVSGAVPILVGYVAVKGVLDTGAIIIFCILALWQMPHFFAIAMYRLHDYQKASIPVLPIFKNIKATKRQMFIYTVLFFISTLALYLYGYAGILYLIVMSLCGGTWVVYAYKGLFMEPSHEIPWARRMFFMSLIVLVVLCAVVIVEKVFLY